MLGMCPDCRHPMSSSASACPHCGRPAGGKRQIGTTRAIVRAFLIIFLGFTILWAIRVWLPWIMGR